MGVGAVEDGEVTEGASGRGFFKNGIRYVPPFLILVVEDEGGNRVPCAVGGPEGFALAVGVFGDDGVGGVENRPGGAVVLLEADDCAAGELFLKAQDILNGGAAEFINTLVVVAHDTEVAASLS